MRLARLLWSRPAAEVLWLIRRQVCDDACTETLRLPADPWLHSADTILLPVYVRSHR